MKRPRWLTDELVLLFAPFIFGLGVISAGLATAVAVTSIRYSTTVSYTFQVSGEIINISAPLFPPIQMVSPNPLAITEATRGVLSLPDEARKKEGLEDLLTKIPKEAVIRSERLGTTPPIFTVWGSLSSEQQRSIFELILEPGTTLSSAPYAIMITFPIFGAKSVQLAEYERTRLYTPEWLSNRLKDLPPSTVFNFDITREGSPLGIRLNGFGIAGTTFIRNSVWPFTSIQTHKGYRSPVGLVGFPQLWDLLPKAK